MIVMKFGGTSVESATAISRVAAIVRSRLERRPLVVVSAMGKTTNRLLAAADQAAAGNLADALTAVQDLREFHQCEIAALLPEDRRPALETTLDGEFSSLEATLQAVNQAAAVTPALWDATASHGERLSSALIALAFPALGVPASHLDARHALITDTRHTLALPLYSRTYARFRELAPPLLEKGVVVMGGFIGSSSAGVVTTLGRGGSDFSAAIAGAGLDAEEIQIWTDVDGMLTCDPRVLSNGRRIRTVSFDEAAEMAYFGAKVLHPATVQPAMEKGIPVRILNSRRPEVEGTLIVAREVKSANPVKSIACKRGITVVHIRSLRMLMAHGFLRRIFEVFDRFRTPVDMVATSEVSVSLTIDQTHELDNITAELARIADVSVVRGQAIVCLVGDAIRDTPGVAARAFAALREINVGMISQGASRRNLSVVLSEDALRPALERLHEEFFSTLDPEVFA